MALDLDQLSIAKPCSANWDEMSGDERVRHCGLCKLNVYNLTSMSTEDAEALIREKEGKLCVRMFKRADGTLLAQDCPVGLAKLRKRMAWLAGAMAASFFFAAGSVLAKMGFQGERNPTASPSFAVKNWLNPPPPQNQVVMGKICPVPLTPTPPTPPPTPAPATPADNSTGQQ
jgi:hypothetical protein